MSSIGSKVKKEDSMEKQKVKSGAEIIEIYSNTKTREKLLILLDNQTFSLIGKGKIRVIFGKTDIMGYEIDSEKNKNEFDFDLNKNFFLFKCLNLGILLNKDNLKTFKEVYESFYLSNSSIKINNNTSKSPLSISLTDFLKLGVEKYFNRKISLVYFNSISEDFKFLDLNLHSSFASNKNSSINKLFSEFLTEKQAKENFILDLEIIDPKNYADNTEFDIDTLKKNKKFSIFGKKNSGKSTFLIYFINAFLSNLNKNFSENCNLFLLDCDSGQPLIGCPYNISLLKISKPIFMNFFKQNIYTQLDSDRKINLMLKENNFHFSDALTKSFIGNPEIKHKIKSFDEPNLSHSPQDENKDSVDSVGKNIIKNKYENINHPISSEILNILNKVKSEKSIELIRSIFVDDNSPVNNFEIYLNAVKNLYNLYNTINNFALKRIKNEFQYQIKNNNYNRRGFNINNLNYINDNLKNYLIINTNGYTSGIGNIINSSINDLIEPDFIFFIKNLKAGRIEKGEELENLLLNNQINYNNNVITRKFKLPEEQEKSGILYNYKRLEKTTILIHNNFKLKENDTLNKKNFNKIYHIISNLVGDYSFDNHGENDDKLSIFNSQKYKNFYDLISDRKFVENFLLEISFDDILFSFDFSLFEPVNELDVLMSLNNKMCISLINENSKISHQQHNNSTSYSNNPNIHLSKRESEEENNLINIKNFNGNFSVIDSRSLKDKIFKCFCYIYNVDIIHRKLFVFSKQLKDEKVIYDMINKKANRNNNHDTEDINDDNNNNNAGKKFELIIYRNSNLDKNLYDSIFLKEDKSSSQNICNNKAKATVNSNFLFENLLIQNKFDFSNFIYEINNYSDDVKINTFDSSKNYYLTRNKFNII